ncbi:MAG: 1-(5-phosphoribosyl)-5-[(5-phosphoribosylamino)methylideneamino]imidazole-4-carboxamide isomerase [Oscillospiraceae bacterium]|nr:1-(5-phosphoribosyl)-5-[(5-phosphoribosylamino)methylideneamino]imidazole-4-carboxamide isomerase [Oscillospiraceae bacterium]
MIIFPAIDIIGGQCVRLVRGDYATASKVAEDPLETAKKFEAAGAEWIHMVDLDGAKAGYPVNTEIYENIAKHTHLKVEVGGGIRTPETIRAYLDLGITRVILGSAALKNPQLVADAVRQFGADRIVVGIDAKNEMVAAEGWLETSNVHYIDLAKEMIKAGVKTFIFTDISKDGTLSGVSTEQLRKLRDAVGDQCNIVASGGVHTIEDIRICRELGLYGTIAGKSLYQGTLDLSEAIREADSIVIRPMTIADYDAAYAIWTACQNGLNNLDDSREGIAKYLARNPNTSFVAEENGVAAGVILCGHDGRRGYIQHMSVDPAYRRRGIAKRLLERALAALKAEGIHKAALVAFKKNAGGNAFWEAQGFTLREDLNYRNLTLTEMTRIDPDYL